MSTIWQYCLEHLKQTLTKDEIDTWISPLSAIEDNNVLTIYVPNQFVLSHVNKNYANIISDLISDSSSPQINLLFKLGSNTSQGSHSKSGHTKSKKKPKLADNKTDTNDHAKPSVKKTTVKSNLNPYFKFDNHVQGKSNQLARAAALQVGQNPGNKDYNPLFIYGGVGLGKTHLMQAAGNVILSQKPDAKVFYIHSERFVADYVKAIQERTTNQFKSHLRSLDALLIDDIQFFAEKKGSQEEFFHTFNQLLELNSQIIITSDTIPKELGVEERLVSRFSMGLAIPVNPPELETRVAILNAKAKALKINLPSDVAFFIAKQIRSNVRELEGALNRVNADATFTGNPIDIALAREALRDILLYNERKITIEFIQKKVAEYYNIRVSDLLSKKRNQPIARARQMAMKCSKELTNHSLPEIGESFGGRDHTTVLHAYRKIDELKDTDTKTNEDFNNLMRILDS